MLGEHAAAQGDDTGLVEDVPVNLENDKTFALMGVAKTLQTVH